MKQAELENLVTETIKQIGNRREHRMDTTNPLLRKMIREIIAQREADRAVLALPNAAPARLPGCRELFGDLLTQTEPAANPTVQQQSWKFMDETRGRQ